MIAITELDVQKYIYVYKNENKVRWGMWNSKSHILKKKYVLHGV
jgi:hypothetical protein